MAVEFVYSTKKRRRFNSHSKYTVRASTNYTSLYKLLSGERTMLPNKVTMNAFTNNLPLTSSLSRINKRDGDFL